MPFAAAACAYCQPGFTSGNVPPRPFCTLPRGSSIQTPQRASAARVVLCQQMRRPVVRKIRLLALAAACTALLLLLCRQQRQRSALELLYYPPEQVAPPPPSSQWLAVPPLSATELPDDRCVFLLETSGRSRLSAREWCAVESVSRADPSLTVVVLVTSPLLRRTSLSDSLLSGNSTLLRQLQLAALFRHTPLHGWYQSRRVLAARWPSAHMSDAVRFALLYRHGGLYLDTDVIVRRPLAGKGCTVSTGRRGVTTGR